MFVKAMPPFGFPDWYYPGYIRALDRLIALNAAHYVPSHFDSGSRKDLIEFRNMMVDFRDAVSVGLSKFNYEAASGKNLRAVMDGVYPVLQERYGDWHGFDAMFVPHFWWTSWWCVSRLLKQCLKLQVRTTETERHNSRHCRAKCAPHSFYLWSRALA